MDAFHVGWVYDEQQIAASVDRLTAEGHVVSFADATPALRGYWQSLQARGYRGVWAQDDELKVLGHHRETNTQSRGTCVWQGTSRAAEDVHLSRIADGAVVGRYALLAYEAGYGGCRQQFGWGASHPWGCRCGRCPDGLVGANAAEWLATTGIIERGIYGNVDLTHPREDLAITWGNAGGIPQPLIDASTHHKFRAHRAHDLDEFADGLAAKCWGAVCLPVIFDGSKHDADGFCLPSGRGGHCTECCAVLLDSAYEDAFGFQQSWPLDAVRFPKEIAYAGGTKALRPGAYVVRRATLEPYLNESEFWLFDLPGTSSFREEQQ